MIDLNGEALVAFKEELESKYQNLKVVTKQLDLTSLLNQNAFDELDEELKLVTRRDSWWYCYVGDVSCILVTEFRCWWPTWYLLNDVTWVKG